MKAKVKLLTLVLAVLMLVSVLPLHAFAATYSVALNCGPEGWGSTAWPLTKTSGTPLPLLHTKQEIFQTYGMLPGKQVLDDQRTFIEWNTAYNATTGRGTGTSYYDYYTADKATTLYAIWGYNIQYNADGGTFPNPTSGKDIYLTYVASYNLQNQSDPKTDYSYCLPDLFGNTPTKAGCRRVDCNGKPAYALLAADLSFFCWESADQNLTIPPTGGYMEWSVFHCANSAKGPAPEFLAIWEPSVTYNANGGKGSMSKDYLTWTYEALWDYESYTAKSCKFSKSGAIFKGWNTKADGTGVSVPVGTQLGGQRTNSDPITLYAQWSDTTPTYKMTFDANGGTLSGTTTYSIKKGATYKSVIGSTMPTPTRSGYTFDGWYNEKYGYTLNLNDTFSVSENVTFKAQWTAIPHTHSYTSSVTKAATCTETGVRTYKCSCGDSYTVSVAALGHNYTTTTKAPTCTAEGSVVKTCQRCADTVTTVTAALGHSWSAWVETTPPTTTAAGVETKTCNTCGATETQEIPKLEAAESAITDVSNYTVTISGIKDVKEIRYAIGHYTVGSEVRNAEKNQTLSAALVNSYTVDGVMTYEVPWIGEYTFWIRYNDGSQQFLYCNVDDINPYLTSDGLRLTVKDFGENYKDMWIAEGSWNSYSEIKNKATVKYQAGAAKLANYFANHDFTYTTANPGEHTVLIRYNDNTQDVLHINLTVDVPTFEVNGLQVTVGNIPGVKIIRTAYGEYNSVAEIKGAAGVRNFNNKTAIKDAETYKVQYRDNGVVTMIVEYVTGYKHIEHINIAQKTSTVTQDGNKVTIGDLMDGFIMVRYAQGTYKTPAGVKEAAGSKYVKEATDGKIVVENLKAGTYTFCVQYDDESFNFHYITVE